MGWSSATPARRSGDDDAGQARHLDPHDDDEFRASGRVKTHPRRLPPGAAGGQHVVVIGFGPAGQTLVRLLRSLDVSFVAVDTNPSAATEAQRTGEPVLYGDATRPQVLRHLGVAEARLVAVAISDPLATRRIVSRIRAMAPATPIVARTRYVREVDRLSAAGASEVVAEEFEGSIELVARALEHFDVPTGAIARFTEGATVSK